MAKKTKNSKYCVHSKLDPSVIVCDLRCETKVWFAASPFEFGDDYLQVFDLLTDPIRTRVNFFQTYNMADWKPANARTFSSPKTWVRRAKPDASHALFVREARAKGDAAISGVETRVYGEMAQFRGDNTDFIRQIRPADELRGAPEDFLSQVLEVCERVPFLCGTVGFSLEVSPMIGSGYEGEGQTAAYGLSMRHPGATIGGRLDTAGLRIFPGVGGVSWLTLVGEPALERLGGRDALKAQLSEHDALTVHETKYGLVVRAGPQPELGDVNKGRDVPNYRAVYQALRAVIEPVGQFVLALRMRTDDDHGRTIAWHGRFG